MFADEKASSPFCFIKSVAKGAIITVKVNSFPMPWINFPILPLGTTIEMIAVSSTTPAILKIYVFIYTITPVEKINSNNVKKYRNATHKIPARK